MQKGASCLSKLEQSPPKSVLKSMQPLLNAIAKPELLEHRDGEVKLFVASCICEITRITAPEAPYDDHILKVLPSEEYITNGYYIITASFLSLFFFHHEYL